MNSTLKISDVILRKEETQNLYFSVKPVIMHSQERYYLRTEIHKIVNTGNKKNAKVLFIASRLSYNENIAIIIKLPVMHVNVL